MNLLSKIILTLIWISIFIFLIFVTFITSNFSSYEKLNYENSNIWLFELKKDENNIFSKKESTNTSTWNIFIKQVGINDKIFFSKWDIKVDYNSNETILSISKWIYYFNLKEIKSKYIIKWEWFEIKNTWPWEFIVNNTKTVKTTIFSINSILQLDLNYFNKNKNETEKTTSIDLYPHMHITFNPLKNIFVKNSDLLKISQTFNLWYFSWKIINDNVISERFLNFISQRNKENEAIISESILYIKQESKKSREIINSFIKSNFIKLPWQDFISKYYLLFINPTKKSLYYKNIIIKDLSVLLENKKIDIKSVNIIKDNLEELWKIDPDWKKQIENIIKYFYENVIKSNDELFKKINLSNLITKIENKNLNLYLKSFIHLEKIFFDYDYSNNKEFYKEINKFKKEYFEDLKINNKLNNDNKANIYDIEKIDYFLFFLENILLTSSFNSSEIKTYDLIVFFDDYVEISRSFYNYNNNTIKRTWIFTNSKILNKFIKILKEKYFNNSKDSLLKIKDDIVINKDDIILLEKNINKIISFFEENKYILKEEENNKDKFIIRLYSKIEKNYKEYFIALKNYEEYLLIYDKSKKDLLLEETVNEITDEKIILWEEHIIWYLKYFNWLRLNNLTTNIMDYNYCKNPIEENEKIEVKNPYCYNLKDLYIDWNKVSFTLYPFEKNKIDYIYVNNTNKSWSYKLDELKEIYKERAKDEVDDKEKYNFKNFLLNNLWQKKLQDVSNNISEDVKIDTYEDPVVKIFKRNKLLWETWDFKNLEGFIDISYSNLIVEKVDSKYTTNINWSKISFSLSKNEKFYWELSSEYIFTPSHSFINPKIKLIDKKRDSDLLIWNEIEIIWEYKINNIKEEIKYVFEKYNKINFIINTIKQKLLETNIKIIYIKDTDELNFEIPYKWDIIYLSLEWSNITNVKLNWKNIINSLENYKNLPNILNNL